MWRDAGNRAQWEQRSMIGNRATTVSASVHDCVRDAQELGDKSARRPVRPHGVNDDAPLGRRERALHDAGDADICQRAGNEGDAGTGLHQHQRGLKVLDFGDNPNVHMQRVEQIEDMPAAAWATLGVSDDGILIDEIHRLEMSSAGKTMSLRERDQPPFGPNGIADDRWTLDRRKHQAKVDPATLQRPNLCDGWPLQQVKLNLWPLLPLCGDDARQRAGHHVLRSREPQPSALAIGHRQRCHLGVVEVIEHFTHIMEKGYPSGQGGCE